MDVCSILKRRVSTIVMLNTDLQVREPGGLARGLAYACRCRRLASWLKDPQRAKPSRGSGDDEIWTAPMGLVRVRISSIVMLLAEEQPMGAGSLPGAQPPLAHCIECVSAPTRACSGMQWCCLRLRAPNDRSNGIAAINGLISHRKTQPCFKWKAFKAFIAKIKRVNHPLHRPLMLDDVGW